MLEFIRVATAVPAVQVGNVIRNTEDICKKIREADAESCDLLLFPELALSGYTCADLFFQDTLQAQCMKGLETITRCSAEHPALTIVVGTPAILEGQMYNCAAVISGGKLRGLVPKTYLPNYNEFSERRWFSSSMDLQINAVCLSDLGLSGEETIPVGRDLLFRIGDGCIMGVEICEDLWTPLPPSTLLSINGAEVIVNLSASNETVGKRAVRDGLVSHQSDICNCIYVYCSSGYTESTQDLVFSGHSIISECGTRLGQNEKLMDSDYLLVRDADFGRVRAARRKNKSVRDAASFYGNVEAMRTVDCDCAAMRSDGTRYPVERQPFAPKGKGSVALRCLSAFEIQVAGLKQHLRTYNAAVTLTGGQDSTLALLVAVEAMRRLGRPTADVCVRIAADGAEAELNARLLAEKCGVTVVSSPQGDEEQTVIVESGDLSELALGMCTHSGGCARSYAVNASVPKTLVTHMLQTLAQEQCFAPQAQIIEQIVRTASAKNAEPFGPFELHDFFLYYMTRYTYSPTKIHALACRAFADTYTPQTIRAWMQVFYRRFFEQQYRRNSMPEGAKIGAISLSPRGDWRMPGDAAVHIWLEEIDGISV